MKEEIYDIGGMHCAACSSAVERVTRKMDGVSESEVNLPMNRMRIVYDESKVTPEMIIKKVERAGFTAKLRAEEEDVKPQKNNEENELKNEKISLWISVIMAGLLLIVSMGQMMFPNMPIPDIISMDKNPYNFAILQMLLTIPVLYLGKKFFIGGFNSLFHGNPNMDTLVAVSSTASFLFSVVMTFLIGKDTHYVHNLYFESASVVVALVSVGKYLEAINKEKTTNTITSLMKLNPDTALLVDENGTWEVPVSKIKTGDTVLVKPGTQIPLDGIIKDGSGSADESMLTGESMPVEKKIGDEVIGGSVLVNGAIYVTVTATGSDTTLSKIIKFVEDAQGKKAPIAKMADKVAGGFVPVVMAIAVISAVIWLLVGKEFSFALKIFTSVLVIACPCAMGLATPTATIVGTGLGASKGILIRNGEALEITHSVKTVVFDKTGTVTEGKPSVTEIIGENNTQILSAAYALEKLSDHPLSKAICDKAKESDITAPEVKKFDNITGKGIVGNDDAENEYAVGNVKLMDEKNIDINDYRNKAQELEKQGKTVVYIAENGKALGIIAIADKIKTDAKDTISQLKNMGVKTVILTGDNRAAAEEIGRQCGADEVISEVLPTEKAEVIKKYQENGDIVMMVGDGINDAPALTQADIGCAIGNGSHIAIDSAQIVLMKNDVMDVVRAIRLSRYTIANIKQNLFWAFCYNTLGIPVAAGVLYPAFNMLLSPMIGALAMSLSSLFVVSNALRLKTKKI